MWFGTSQSVPPQLQHAWPRTQSIGQNQLTFKCTLLLCFCMRCYQMLCTWDKPEDRQRNEKRKRQTERRVNRHFFFLIGNLLGFR